MLKKTASILIGERAPPELSQRIRDLICEFPQVHGIYGLAIHDYGPKSMQGTLILWLKTL